MEGWFADLRWGLAKKEGVVFLKGWGLIPQCTLRNQHMQKTKAKANNTVVRAKLAWITLQCLRTFIFQCLTLIK